VETYDSSEGYKVFKLPSDGVEIEEEDAGRGRGRQESSGGNGQYQDNMIYQNYMPSYPYAFPFEYVPSNR
jgi:hypothetical protein